MRLVKSKNKFAYYILVLIGSYILAYLFNRLLEKQMMKLGNYICVKLENLELFKTPNNKLNNLWINLNDYFLRKKLLMIFASSKKDLIQV